MNQSERMRSKTIIDMACVALQQIKPGLTSKELERRLKAPPEVKGRSPPAQLISVQTAAKQLCVCTRTISNLIQRGELVSVGRKSSKN